MLVRGIRYLDRLRATPDGWRIYDRIHTCDWSSEASLTSVVPFVERVTR